MFFGGWGGGLFSSVVKPSPPPPPPKKKRVWVGVEGGIGKIDYSVKFKLVVVPSSTLQPWSEWSDQNNSSISVPSTDPARSNETAWLTVTPPRPRHTLAQEETELKTIHIIPLDCTTTVLVGRVKKELATSLSSVSGSISSIGPN